MLTEKILSRLNNQVNLEFYSSNLYLQMSAWCADNGLNGSSAFLRAHAKEEMQHMHKLFDYVIGTGAMPILNEIKKPKSDFNDIKDVFETIFEHEKYITKQINKLVSATFEEKDFSSFNFLQWYVGEQHEEEKLFKSILDKIIIIGTKGQGLFMLDKEIERMPTKTH